MVDLNRNIKEIIEQYPQVEGILNEYNIGCTTCKVGTCLVKDIINIHSLSPEEEGEIMARIAKVVYPDRKIEIPRIERKPESRVLKYSPPIRKLVDEHVLIKRWLALIPGVIAELGVNQDEALSVVKEGLDFVRSYADRFHHAKEEEVLFKYFDESLDILKVMHTEHEEARVHVKVMLEALDRADKRTISERLDAYRELLTEHIKKEDEILYPWMDRNLTVSQVGELFSRFTKIDEEFGSAPEKYEKFINQQEKILKPLEV